MRRRDRDGSTVDEDVAAIRLRQPGKNADQRRLSGAVCPDKAVYPAGQKREEDTPFNALAPP